MDYAGQGQANATSKPASRINQDVERLLTMVKRVHRERERVVLHTSALGYYAQPTPEDRALDQLAGAVNLFE
jgi:hypothetical protein